MEVVQSPERKPDGITVKRESYPNNSLMSGWKTTPNRLAKQVPLVIELKPSTIMSASALGLSDLAKPLTLHVTEKDKMAGWHH